MWSTFFSHPNSQNNGGATLYIDQKFSKYVTQLYTLAAHQTKVGTPLSTQVVPLIFGQVSMALMVADAAL